MRSRTYRLNTESEHAIQCAVVRWAKLKAKTEAVYSMLFAVPNGMYSNPRIGAKMVSEGLKKGVPDLQLPIPVPPWHGLFIEMKTAKGRLSDEQRKWILNLRNQKYAVQVCRSVEEAVGTIESYLVGNFTPAPLPATKTKAS